RQIRDALFAREKFTEPDMLDIQLDDRALFLTRWQRLASSLLTPETCEDDPWREAVRREVRSWGGRAAVSSVGYRMVREFRLRVRGHVLSGLTAPCYKGDPNFSTSWLDSSVEDVVWELVTKKPPHLLPPYFRSWDGLLFEAIDGVASEVNARGGGGPG